MSHSRVHVACRRARGRLEAHRVAVSAHARRRLEDHDIVRGVLVQRPRGADARDARADDGDAHAGTGVLRDAQTDGLETEPERQAPGCVEGLRVVVG